jgi:hypothetical protein
MNGYGAWRIQHQDSEEAAKAAFSEAQELRAFCVKHVVCFDLVSKNITEALARNPDDADLKAALQHLGGLGVNGGGDEN